MEHDEHLQALNDAKRAALEATAAEEAEAQALAEAEEAKEKERKKRIGIDFSKIVTSITDFMNHDSIE